ncbi:MAG: phosphate/phosphite/phosphonate ABC transporter substrate-binding protein [Nitrospinae bacterium]|nr:phosphate/phosphite/phosphonate ABC transporter substrate-binding protein [Nitrospinota bacterium]
MLRIGGTASPGHITVFRGLKTHFQQQGIALDWVLYSNYDALVEAFATHEIDLAWNGPISYVQIKQRLNDACRVVAMRDVDVNVTTQVFARRDSSITTLEGLKGKRVALGSRGSAQAGLLPYYFLKQHGLDPQRDLAACTFSEDREPSPLSDERAVVELVLKGEYDAGAVSHRTLEVLSEQGQPIQETLRVIWSSPGYSHCCFTAHRELEAGVAQKITDAFISMHYKDPLGKEVMDAEGCKAFLPGITTGWEALESALREPMR